MARHFSCAMLIAALVTLVSFHLNAQTPVPPDRLLNSAKEPQNWLTYGGDYFSNRYSTLTQITPANVKSLGLAWAYQSPTSGSWETTPLVVDGIMYLTQRPNDVVALDAVTGRAFWMYRYNNVNEIGVCCGSNNRGLAILGDTLFMGTLDAHVVAIDTKSGLPLWNTKVGESKNGYSITVAPLAVKDRIIVGLGGGEFGIRGAIAALDAQTGKELWRFNAIPGPGEAGHETWEPCPPNPKTYC
ncbi:MAG TPA: PQQ-binding-like beta-propeller repeat protein, partial [Vicinamibacterales bacterium]|nr:PQQ-binding-like beta-propeller repeat protein [Vicinamibacterales bacterium]